MPTEKVAPKPISLLDVAWKEWSEVPRFGVRYCHLSRAAMAPFARRVPIFDMSGVRNYLDGEQTS